MTIMKMKCAVLFAVMGITTFSCFAVRVRIPRAEVLRFRLKELGFNHFVEHTNIVELLAGKTLNEKNVVYYARIAKLSGMQKALKHLIGPEMLQIILDQESDVIGAVIQNYQVKSDCSIS